jgi:hypothetical protein
MVGWWCWVRRGGGGIRMGIGMGAFSQVGVEPWMISSIQWAIGGVLF